MPAQTPDPQTPALRNTRLVRTLLLTAMGAGLLGLSQTSASADRSGLVRVSSASSVITLPTSRADEVPPLRASRTATARTVLAPKAVVATSKAKPTAKKARWYRPCAAGVVSNYGHRWGRMHEGIDFGGRHGANIRAIGDGVVIGAGYLGSESGYGKITLIRHKGGIVSAYAHQSKILVSTGERVKGGEVIGLVGSTGHSTGPHLHFEIRTGVHGGQINPRTWLREHGVYV